MKKLLFSTLLLLLIGKSLAQDAISEATASAVAATSDSVKEGWTKQGTASFLLNQSSFSNWIAGGVNNIAGNANINYDLNYKKGDWTWDNRVILAYGLAKTDDTDTRKTDDRLEFNSVVGKKAFKNWSYSFLLNFRTQFTDGFNYDVDPSARFRNSGLFRPAYLTFGPGMLWKKNDNLKVNLSPLSSKMTFISGEIFTLVGDTDNSGVLGDSVGEVLSSDNVETFGVEAGKSLRYELGFFASGYYKFNLMKNVSIENILNLYTNYLEETKNVDVDYTMNAVLQINKYLSTNLTFQMIYDDNAFKGLQTRQLFGLGVNFNF